MMRSRLVAYAVGFAVAAALAGCGDSDGGSDEGGSNDFADEKPADIVDAAQQAMGELESLHISGDTQHRQRVRRSGPPALQLR